jgi:hypothetical protein
MITKIIHFDSFDQTGELLKSRYSLASDISIDAWRTGLRQRRCARLQSGLGLSTD